MAMADGIYQVLPGRAIDSLDFALPDFGQPLSAPSNVHALTGYPALHPAKHKDARGRWQDKVRSARAKAQAVEMLREIAAAEDRTRHGPETRPSEDGGGTVDELIEWWADRFRRCPEMPHRG
jgi:hypothetical protein